MMRYTVIFVVIGVVAFMFNQRYQAQREQRAETERLERLDAEIRIKSPSSDLNDYCDTICQIHHCQGGHKDVDESDRCVCFDQYQNPCELT